MPGTAVLASVKKRASLKRGPAIEQEGINQPAVPQLENGDRGAEVKLSPEGTVSVYLDPVT